MSDKKIKKNNPYRSAQKRAQKIPVPESVDYAAKAFAAAIAVGFAAAPTLEADIVYSGTFGLTNMPIPASTFLGLQIDVDGMNFTVGGTTSVADISFFNRNVGGSNILSFFGSPGSFGVNGIRTAGGSALRLATGVSVSGLAGGFGSTAALGTHLTGSTSTGNWAGGGSDFVGFSFKSGGNTHYGWARLDINPGTLDGVVRDFAYNDTPGAPIRTGAIPEASTLGLLAAGAAGIAALRKRRAAKSA